jgi:D-tyrosyl-tRNA(Tyr) deacylase
MIALIQRVSEAGVTISGLKTASINSGLLVLLGIKHGDSPNDPKLLARKTAALRIFSDDCGKMNLSVSDTGGEILVISQFTLCAETRKGNRPSFINAAPPEEAIPLYESFIAHLGTIMSASRIKTGEFGADMKVNLINDGPVTITLTSGERDI